MLATISKKLCPLVSMIIATVGCGKKISENPSNVTGTIENQELPSALVIKFNGHESFRTIYQIPRNGVFNMPESLWVREGSSAGRKVTITYNTYENFPEDFEYKCIYEAGLDTNQMPFKECTNAFGVNIGNVSGSKFQMEYGKVINIRVTEGSSAGFVVDAIYSMDWK